MASIMLICGNNILNDFIRYTSRYLAFLLLRGNNIECVVYDLEPLSASYYYDFLFLISIYEHSCQAKKNKEHEELAA